MCKFYKQKGSNLLAYIEVTSTSENSIGVRMSGLDTAYDQSLRWCDWYLDGSFYGSKSISNQASSGASYIFSGLSAGIRYVISANITNEVGTLNVWLSTEQTTEKPPVVYYTDYLYKYFESQNGEYLYDGYTTETGVEGGQFTPSLHIPLYDTSTYCSPTIYVGSDNSGTIASGSYTAYSDLHFAYYYPRLLNLSVSAIQPDQTVLSGKISWTTASSPSGLSFMVYKKKRADASWVLVANNATSPTYISVDFIGVYDFLVEAYINGVLKDSKYIALDMVLTKPTTWYWASAETNAFNNHGDITNLTKDRWNTFISKINSCITYKNQTSGTSYSLIPSSAMMQSDKILYATSWNVIVSKLQQITNINSSVPINASSGNTIVGAYFIYLSDALNSYINNA